MNLYSEYLFWELFFQKHHPELSKKREVLSAAQLNNDFDSLIQAFKKEARSK